MDELDSIIRQINEEFGEGTITTANETPRPQSSLDREAFDDFNTRNPMAGGGMLVQPSADGSRPGYAIDKRNNNYRVTGKRGDTTYGQWANENNLPQTFPTKKEAEAAQKKFYEDVSKKTDISKAKWVDEITALSNEFNTKVIKDFNNGDMSKTPSWKSFLESKKLKHATSGAYRSLASQYNVIDTRVKKLELADRLIAEASEGFKFVPWMDIQKKLTKTKAIDTGRYRDYIDKHNKINGQAAKVSKAFDYLYDNDIQLKLPKNLSKTMATEGSLLRKVIADLTGAGKAGIVEGLNMNDAYIKNIDQIKFANQGNLWTQGEGRTLSEILENADYRMKGNISWTSDIKLSNRANKNVFDYALRNFNYHQLNKTGEGTIQFYDKKTNKPIDWNTLPKNKNGFRVLKPNSVYFIDASMPNKKWDMTSIDADNLKWSKGKGSSGLFDEVFLAKDKYDKLLATKVEDPRNPKKQISFGKLMSEVYQTGFDNFGNPYAIEHADGVAKNPFKNLKIASQRVNSALSSLNRDTKLAKSQKNKIFKELQKNVFNPADKNMIDSLIKSTQSLQSDVLVKGQTFDQSEIQTLLASFGDGNCPVTFGPKKRDGGRIGYQVGTIDKKRCIDQGIKNFNDGKFKTADQVQDAAKLLSGGRRVLSGLMKYGIIPELAFVGLEATGRSILGEKPLNAIKKSIDTFTFGLTDFTSGIEAEKFGKFGDLKLDVDKYRNSLAKVNSIQQDIANLEALNTGSDFGYEGDQTEAIQMKKVELEAAKKELQQNMISPDKVSVIDRMADNIADAQMAKSAYAKASAKDQMIGMPGVADYMDTDQETARVFPRQPSQVELNLNMLPSFKDYQKSDQGQIDRTILNAPDEVLQEISPDALDLKKALQEEYKMENLKNTFGAEQIYGTQGVFSQPLAGGGIAKMAGVDQGPPPESGPNAQGLQGLMKRVKNI